jgi:hypothetical protein
MAQQILSTNTFTTAKWIVSANASDGTHTTIASALTSASSGDTIFIRPGTYTENLTLVPGVNLASLANTFSTSAQTLILGKATLSSGTVIIDNIYLKTNLDNVLSVSGTASIDLINCFISSLNAVPFNTDSGKINFYNCNLQDSNTGQIFTCINASNITMNNCSFIGTGSTASTIAGSSGITITNSTFQMSITTSSTAQFQAVNSNLGAAANNSTILTNNGTGASNFLYNCSISSGTASSISVGTGATLTAALCVINSSNTNAITGLGTLNYGGLVFGSTSSTINTTTTNPIAFSTTQGGTGRTTLTNHGVLIGAGTSAVTQLVTGSAGQALLSGGASADPAYSTPTYPSASGSAGTILRSDGTNNVYTTATYPATTTINQMLYSSAANTVTGLATANNGVNITGTTGIPSVLAAGTTGQVLIATTGSPPSWGSAPAGSGVNKVIRQVFVATGTYTPSANMLYCDVEVVGGGGGGGGFSTAATSASCGGGGGGGYSRKVITSAAIGASQAVTIGAAGTAGANTGGTGGTGGTSGLGAILSATGGVGGVGASTSTVALGGVGGVGSSGDFNINGNPGLTGTNYSPITSTGGAGGCSHFGGGAVSVSCGTATSIVGNAGLAYGGGGSGAAGNSSATARIGGAGFAGIVIVTEYTS